MTTTSARGDAFRPPDPSVRTTWGTRPGPGLPLHSPRVTVRPARATHRLTAVLLAAAAGIWGYSLQHFDLGAVDGLGLFSAAPWTFWLAAAVLLTGVATILAAEDPPMRWGVAYLVALVVILHATPGIVEAHPRFPTAWTHVGFVDQIVENGTVQTDYDARYNWPGAFSLGAFLTELAGLETSRALLRWTPVVMNLLSLTGLALIARQVTRDRRIQLTGLCTAVLASWVGQDYLAPQAVAVVLYLTLIGVLLTYFGRPTAAAATEDAASADAAATDAVLTDAAPTEDLGPSRRTALYLLVVLIASVLAFTHQLTPFVLAAAALGLVAIRRIDRPLLPLTILAVTLTWVVVGATPFLRSNLSPMVQSIGDIGGALGENVDERARGSAQRDVVLDVRLLLTAVIVGLSAIGLLRQWRAGRANWALVLLAAVPLPMLVLNSYGGEVLLRALLFATPFLAMLVPFALFTEGGGRRRWVGVAAFTLLSMAAVPAFVIARYGNESFERIHGEDIAAWGEAIRLSEPGTRVLVPSFAGPWRYSDLLHAEYVVYPDVTSERPTVDGVRRLLAEGGPGSLLVLGEGTARFGEVFEGEDPDWQDALADALLAVPGHREVYREGAARIIELTDPGAAP